MIRICFTNNKIITNFFTHDNKINRQIYIYNKNDNNDTYTIMKSGKMEKGFIDNPFLLRYASSNQNECQFGVSVYFLYILTLLMYV